MSELILRTLFLPYNFKMIENKDIQREQIIDGAREVFAQYGFKKTTLDDIAKSTGKAKSSLYYYFNGKEEMFIAVLSKEAEILREQIKVNISSTTDVCEQIKQYIVSRMLYIRKLSNIYTALSDDILNTIYLSVDFRKQYDEAEKMFLRKILEKGAAQGLFHDKIDTQFASTLLVSALKGMEFIVTETSEKDLEKRILEAINILLFGLIRR